MREQNQSGVQGRWECLSEVFTAVGEEAPPARNGHAIPEMDQGDQDHAE